MYAVCWVQTHVLQCSGVAWSSMSAGDGSHLRLSMLAQQHWHLLCFLGPPSATLCSFPVCGARSNLAAGYRLRCNSQATWKTSSMLHTAGQKISLWTAAGDWLVVAVSAEPQSAWVLIVTADLTVTAKVGVSVCLCQASAGACSVAVGLLLRCSTESLCL